MIISEFEFNGKLYQVKQDEEHFHVFCDNVCVQPNHDSAGVVRYLSKIIHNADHLISKKKDQA